MTHLMTHAFQSNQINTDLYRERTGRYSVTSVQLPLDRAREQIQDECGEASWAKKVLLPVITSGFKYSSVPEA